MKSRITLAFILCIALLAVPLCSCSQNRSYDEAEVLSEAERLIEESALWNEIFYGEGIPYEKNESLSNGYYYPADQAYLENAGFDTVEELERLLRKTYTAELSDIIVATKLEAVSDNTGVQGYARYYQKYSSLDKDKSPECIMVYSRADVLLDSEVEYDYSTLSVKESKGQTVFVELSATVTNKEGKSQKRVIVVGLIEEEAGWRIDTPTYLRYLDSDYYEEIQNK